MTEYNPSSDLLRRAGMLVIKTEKDQNSEIKMLTGRSAADP